MTEKNKNDCLYFLKGLACFGIVFMHTCSDMIANAVLVCIFRFCLLLFFMISGYYCYSDDREQLQNKIPIKIKKTSFLCLKYTVIYAVFELLIIPWMYGQNVLDYVIQRVGEIFTIENILNFIAFNKTIFGGVLWYLFAMLYCYILMLFINKYNLYKIAYILVPILLGIHLIVRGYIQRFGVIPEEQNITYFRNYIFMGFPFFMIGNYIHKNENMLIHKMKNKTLIIIALLGIIFSCGERYFVALEVFVGSIVAAIALFIYAIQNPKEKKWAWLCVIGEKYSDRIYYYHMIMSSVILRIYGILGLAGVKLLYTLNPVIVYFALVLVIMLHEKTKIVITKKKKAIK